LLVSAVHDFNYVLAKQHGDYVSKMNMGIKQNPMPLMPSEPHQFGVSPPKEIKHGNIP